MPSCQAIPIPSPRHRETTASTTDLLIVHFRTRNFLPSVTQIVFRHGYSGILRFFTQIFLIDDAVLRDNESHDS